MEDQTGAHRESSIGAELLLRVGAAIIIADWLLFAIILDEYFFFWGTLLVAAYALFAAWVRSNRPAASWPVPFGWTMKLLGYSAGFLGALDLLDDLRFDVLNGAATIIGAIIFYVGAFLMFWGARQLNDTTS